MSRTTVELVPVSPPTEPEPTVPEEGSDEPARISVDDLGARVLAYGPYDHDFLWLRGAGAEPEQASGPTDVALPDGQGGLVTQPAGQTAIWWDSVVLVEAEGEIMLRSRLPDGQAVYSVRPAEDELTENSTEDFFAIALAEGAEPEQIGSRPAYESWHVGPAVAAAGPVHASCHLHCAIRPGLVDAPADAEVLYDGAAIEGLTATPDGLIVAFVEFQTHDQPAPELVLLDGASFDPLARMPIPLDEGDHPGRPVVSLSADGQRVLVTIGAAGTPLVPKTPYLIEAALTDSPELFRVDTEEVLRWLDPEAAAAVGNPVAVPEHAAAAQLIAFARAPGPDTFGTMPFGSAVMLGLGPDLIGSPRPAAALVQPEEWLLDHPDESFRAAVGPWSALDLIARTDDVVVGEGTHNHCASPPMPAPEGVGRLQQVHIQPILGPDDGCLQWWVVDLFLDADAEIVAVTLDVWEP